MLQPDRSCSNQRFSCGWSRHELDVPRLRRWDIRAVPPAATQGLEECGGVGIAGSLSLHQGDQCYLVSVLDTQQPEKADRAELQLTARDLQTLEGGALCRICRLQGVGIRLQGVQRIGDILEGGDDLAAIQAISQTVFCA